MDARQRRGQGRWEKRVLHDVLIVENTASQKTAEIYEWIRPPRQIPFIAEVVTVIDKRVTLLYGNNKRNLRTDLG